MSDFHNLTDDVLASPQITVADGERIALLVAHGAHIAGWELGRTARATLHGHHLTVTTGERMVRPVTLDLGDNAQAWFTRFEALN